MTCCCPDCYSNLYHEECCCECCKTDSSICCYCEKNCVKKGLFTIAWSAETPRTSNKPCGIELELCDTPSNIEQKCEELRQWLCRPPIDDLCECKLKVNEFSCPSTVEALSYSCSCHTSSDFKTDELTSDMDCCCVDESEGKQSTRDQQTNKPSCVNIVSADNATNTDSTEAEKKKNVGNSKSTGKVADKQAINDIKKILNSITNKAFDSNKQNIGIEVQVDGKTEGKPLVCSEIDEDLLKKIIDATNDLLNAQLLFKSPEGEVDRILKEKSACIKICLNENLQTEGQPGNNVPKTPANTPVDSNLPETQRKSVKELQKELAQKTSQNKSIPKTGNVESGVIVPKKHSLIRKVGADKYDLNDEFTILVTCPCTKKPDTSKIVLSIGKQDDQVAYKVTDFQVLRTSLVDINALKDKNINVNVSGEAGDTDHKREKLIASHVYQDENKMKSENRPVKADDEDNLRSEPSEDLTILAQPVNADDQHALRKHHGKLTPRELRLKLQQAQQKRQEDIEKVKHELEKAENTKA